MDALFFNDAGDRYYSGRPIVVTRNTSGAAVVVNVNLSYTPISENLGVLSWPDITFTPTANTSLDIENIPVQFVGTAARNMRMPISVYDNNGLERILGNMTVEAQDREIKIRIYENQDVGGISRPVADSFVIGRSYTIEAGYVVLSKAFT